MTNPRSLVADYRTGRPEALRFFDVDGRDLAAMATLARQRAQTVSTQALSAIRGSTPGPSRAQEESLRVLARGDAAMVVAGQQVGLFGGPLFTLYKAATALALARSLEEASGVPVVPLFWLQTEDHDLYEIDHTFVYRRGAGAIRVGLDRSERTEPLPVSVAYRTLGASVHDALDAVEHAIDGLAHAAEVGQLLRDTHVPGRLVADAFRDVVSAFFADSGLLFLDPRHPDLAAAWRPTWRLAVERWEVMAQGLEARSAMLKAAGYAPQVHVRPDSPLCFVHPDGPQGPRFRMRSTGDGAFRLLGDGRRVELDELLRWSDHDPLRLSTSALLRPAMQDAALPVVATVGGPGEIAYWGQLGPVYDALEVAPRPIVPRWHARLIPSHVHSLLRRIGLDAAALERDLTALAMARGAARGGVAAPDALEQELTAALTEAVDAAARPWTEAFPDLDKAGARTRGTVERAARRFAARCRAAAARADHEWRDRVERAQHALWPQRAPQERVYGFCSFAAEVGPSELARLILHHAAPGWGAVSDVELS